MYTALSCRPYKPIPFVSSFLIFVNACHLKQYQGKALK
nr:MAG TPA: hypothetical protein [Caudoviricetes sp.]